VSVAVLHADLVDAGFELGVSPDGRLAVTPADQLTPRLRDRIRIHRAGLILIVHEDHRPEIITGVDLLGRQYERRVCSVCRRALAMPEYRS
jgi:hypothetical protein